MKAKMKMLKKIDPLSTAKIMGITYAILGLILGILFNLLVLAGFGSYGYTPSLFFGPAALLFLPVFYGALGFLFGLVSALSYNLIAKRFGGVKLEIS